jgi:glycosyltransferase involved in cell wall biosynthesis
VRVLIFTQYFTPEVGATQTRLHTFAAGLAERGHDVDVVCEVPNHPQGVVHPGFRGRPLVRRRVDGFRALHVWVRCTPVKSTANRLAFYASYAGMATLAGSLVRRPDVILASSPPLPVAVAARGVAARHRAPWVMDVRDLWPEAASALGEVTNPRVLRRAEALERSLYAGAAAVTAVTEPFCDAIRAKVAEPDKVVLIPNGTTAFWVEGAQLDPDRSQLGLPADRFVWTFAGNVGLAQGLESAIEAAGRLDDRFQLLVLGDGPAKGELQALASSLAPGRVVFHRQVGPEEARRYLRASDALLVPLADKPALRKFVPSKLFDFCALGRPVVVAAAGEPQRLTDESGAALAVPPGDSRALEQAVRRLRDEPELRARLAESGSAFARRHVRDAGIARLEGVLERAADPGIVG